jgi:hypothetical protein
MLTGEPLQTAIRNIASECDIAYEPHPDVYGWLTTIHYRGRHMTFIFCHAGDDSNGPEPTVRLAVSTLWARCSVIRKYPTADRFAYFMASPHDRDERKRTVPQVIVRKFEPTYQVWLQTSQDAIGVFGERFGG